MLRAKTGEFRPTGGRVSAPLEGRDSAKEDCSQRELFCSQVRVSSETMRKKVFGRTPGTPKDLIPSLVHSKSPAPLT